jgi:hypothetical protein
MLIKKTCNYWENDLGEVFLRDSELASLETAGA